MPWGRERLAESAYEKAVEEMDKPNPDRKKALWHLDCATNLNPKFIEAIELKAQLTGEEVTLGRQLDDPVVRAAAMLMADRSRPTTDADDAAGARRSGRRRPPTSRAAGGGRRGRAGEVPTTEPSADAEPSTLTASTGRGADDPARGEAAAATADDDRRRPGDEADGDATRSRVERSPGDASRASRPWSTVEPAAESSRRPSRPTVEDVPSRSTSTEADRLDRRYAQTTRAGQPSDARPAPGVCGTQDRL